MTVASRGEPRWSRRAEARPAELTAAALSLFVSRGYAATKLDDIAARAGVSKGTLYLYFESKEALFQAVIQEGIEPVLDHGESLLSTWPDDPVRLLQEILLGWWQLVGSTELGGISKLMMAEAQNFPTVAQYYHDNVTVRGKTLVRRALEQGVAAGVFRVMDTEAMVRVLMAPLLNLAMWRHSFASCVGDDADTGRYLDAYLDLTLHGLLARPGAQQ